MTELLSDQITIVRQAIEALQKQRDILGDSVVGATLLALREQLAELESGQEQSNANEIDTLKLVACLVVRVVTQEGNPEYGFRVIDYSLNLLAETVRYYHGIIQESGNNRLVALFSGGAHDPTRAAHASLQMRQNIEGNGTEI